PLPSEYGVVVRPTTDYRVLLDYDTRLDGNPVYVGTAVQTLSTAGTTWVVKKLFYDTLNRLIDSQVLVGVWNDRAALAWKTAGGN
ncbi:MAG: hypothetical protein ACREJP_06155, partial [Candidatus Methylomirabilales bacterium]